MNVSISPVTDRRACCEREKAAWVQKKNNLRSVASIHSHSKGQQTVLDKQRNKENCCYGLTGESDKGTEQILFAFSED